jgi:HD superfamily phosphodiesterase
MFYDNIMGLFTQILQRIYIFGGRIMENRLETLRNEIDKLILKGESDKIRMYISHMYGVARFCTLLAMKRNLNNELATTCGMLHDIYYMTGGSIDNHAAKGAEQAESILKAMNIYSDDEIKIITTAISRHGDKGKNHDPYDELLMDHCLYNTDFPIAEWEVVRYKNLLAEFGLS